jgi:hypothetical protein
MEVSHDLLVSGMARDGGVFRIADEAQKTGQ